ncbi:tripartite tricarboxylate transporter substrate binding protein [Terribacillus saccharophilus]|uniref:Bug family tripartite tricarboxylate transporter substrate binding protein n=1 Tax=Terribacillus saccharophilus TaxID=361277 RepID=UPI0039828959
MKKKIGFILAGLFLFAILAGCASSSSSDTGAESSDYPKKPISIIVSYDAGGGTDTTARTLQPYLEDELGVAVNIINQPGGGGWVGWNEIANAKPDGYTIGFLNSPNIASGLVNPTMETQVTLDDYTFIGNHVADPGVVAIRVDDERFSDFNELIEYAKEHEVTTTATGIAGDDHLVTLKLNEELGTKFKAVQFEGTSKSRAAFLGGHVDVLISSVGEAYPMHQEKQLKIAAVTAAEKSPYLPDVPTVEEAGYGEIIQQSTRGLVAPADVDPEMIEKLESALEKSVNNPDHIEDMKKIGTQASYMDGETYKALLEKDQTDIESLKPLLGW